MSAAAKILDRLDRVKRTGMGRWIACCPAHDDRRPSLHVRELDDGRVLLHDFGGCDIGAVLAAVGLELRDLFDSPREHFAPPSKSRIPARDVLELVSFESDAVTIILAHVVEGGTVSEVAWQRIARAAARIGAAKVYVHGG